MAGRAEKKRAQREKHASIVYIGVTLVVCVAWLVAFGLKAKEKFHSLGVFGCLWRISSLVVGFATSLACILQSIKSDCGYSIWLDLFVITTCVACGSIFTEKAYLLWLLVPTYVGYKGLKVYYNWATTPEPEVPEQQKAAEPKRKVKFRTIRGKG